MQTTIKVKCFPGFYGTIFDEQGIEENEMSQIEQDYPDFKHLSDWGINSDAYRDAVAKEFAETYIKELNKALQLDIKLISWNIWSPREYNFYNDEIDCEIEVGDRIEFVKKVVCMMDNPEYHDGLASIIRQEHTSYSGFWSLMRNNIDDWPYMLLHSKNTAYLECILWYLYCIKTGHSVDSSYDDDSMENKIYDYLASNTDVMSPIPLTVEAEKEYEQYLKNN